MDHFQFTMKKQQNNFAFIDSQNVNLGIQSMGWNIDLRNYNKALIITSDGDFYSLVKYLYEQDKLLKVLSPYIKTCSALLKKTAKEKIVFMDNLRKKLEYKRKSTA